MPTNAANNNHVTAVILAGGAGRRMHGKDKGLLPLHERPLIAHVLDRVEPQVESILINSNRNNDRYAAFGWPVISDTISGGLGPLAGLLTALESSNSEFVLSVPCDTPFLPGDLVGRMLDALAQSGAEACTVFDGERLHPVILLVRHSVVESLRGYLNSGKRKVHDWFYSVPHTNADFSDQPAAFINLNTPSELTQAEGNELSD